MHNLEASTQIIFAAPRDKHSNEIFPVPANKSSMAAFSNASKLFRILNSPVFAKSVVGRTGRFAGAEIILPRHLPLIMRTDQDQKLLENNKQEYFQTPLQSGGWVFYLQVLHREGIVKAYY